MGCWCLPDPILKPTSSISNSKPDSFLTPFVLVSTFQHQQILLNLPENMLVLWWFPTVFTYLFMYLFSHSFVHSLCQCPSGSKHQHFLPERLSYPWFLTDVTYSTIPSQINRQKKKNIFLLCLPSTQLLKALPQVIQSKNLLHNFSSLGS